MGNIAFKGQMMGKFLGIKRNKYKGNMQKAAQFFDPNMRNLPVVGSPPPAPVPPAPEPKRDESVLGGEPDASYADDNDVMVTLEVGGEDPITFELPEVPGADDDSDIEITEGDIEVSEPEDVEVEEANPWNWQAGGLGGFLNWIRGMMDSVPRHSGRDTTGLERAISYFEALNKEITKAMRQDYKNEIDSAKAEEARAAIEDGLERMIDRLEKIRGTKKKKKADFNSDLVKTATSTRINGITITVPLFISTIARMLVNGMVSAGHDIEDMMEDMDEKYKLTARERMEVIQLLKDMGAIHPNVRDRGIDKDEVFNKPSSDNYDMAANFVDGSVVTEGKK